MFNPDFLGFLVAAAILLSIPAFLVFMAVHAIVTKLLTAAADKEKPDSRFYASQRYQNQMVARHGARVKAKLAKVKA